MCSSVPSGNFRSTHLPCFPSTPRLCKSYQLIFFCLIFLRDSFDDVQYPPRFTHCMVCYWKFICLLIKSPKSSNDKQLPSYSSITSKTEIFIFFSLQLCFCVCDFIYIYICDKICTLTSLRGNASQWRVMEIRNNYTRPTWTFKNQVIRWLWKESSVSYWK